MKKILMMVFCFCIALSFSACHVTTNGIHNGSESLYVTEDNNYPLEGNPNKVTVKYGTYILTDMYTVSNEIHIDIQHIETQYIYLENDLLLWYKLGGVLWTCQNYNYSIVGNEIRCVPIYKKGLSKIKFVYDERKDEIIYEAADVRSVFSFYSDDKPVKDDDVFRNM